ncbi:MAG TPA: hypothetical protein VMZ29_13165 [Candidatus Bathyarchaeia archaeon]|nr:hypothetical protein [Candidatus Bathyarchaeia archaeon]
MVVKSWDIIDDEEDKKQQKFDRIADLAFSLAIGGAILTTLLTIGFIVDIVALILGIIGFKSQKYKTKARNSIIISICSMVACVAIATTLIMIFSQL